VTSAAVGENGHHQRARSQKNVAHALPSSRASEPTDPRYDVSFVTPSHRFVTPSHRFVTPSHRPLSTAISDSPVGSIPIRDQTRSEINHATWCLIDLWAAFLWVSPTGLASQTLPGTFWTHGEPCFLSLKHFRHFC